MATNNPSKGNIGGQVSGNMGPTGVKPAGVGAVKVPVGGGTPAPKCETIVKTTGTIGGSPADVSPMSNKQ